VFVFCLIWSFGGCLIENDRMRFNEFVKELMGSPSPANGTLYDNFYDMESKSW
jgi:Dynein heavy chain AAA lid domain